MTDWLSEFLKMSQSALVSCQEPVSVCQSTSHIQAHLALLLHLPWSSSSQVTNCLCHQIQCHCYWALFATLELHMPFLDVPTLSSRSLLFPYNFSQLLCPTF